MLKYHLDGCWWFSSKVKGCTPVNIHQSQKCRTIQLGQGWPNYRPRTASGPRNTLHIFFKHHVSNCGQQGNSVGCHMSLVDVSAAAAVSCKQRYKSVNEMVWFYCYYCTTIYFNNLFLHRLHKSHSIRPSSGQVITNSALGQKVGHPWVRHLCNIGKRFPSTTFTCHI